MTAIKQFYSCLILFMLLCGNATAQRANEKADVLFTSLFSGTNLDGWHTFFSNIETNKDSNNNFRIENGLLHLIGNNLGYMMTDGGGQSYLHCKTKRCRKADRRMQYTGNNFLQRHLYSYYKWFGS